VFNRILILTAGEYNVDVISADSHSGGVTTNIAYETLRDASTTAVQSVLKRGVTTVNPVVTEYGYTDSGTQTGNARPPSAIGQTNVIKEFTGDTYLRITSLSPVDATINLVLTCWEESL